MGRVDGKMALVTGAASGLGAATAHLLACEGAKVAVTDIDGAGAKRVAGEINDKFPGTGFSFEHDVTSEPAWRTTLEAAAGAMGGLNILVNNAGVSSSHNVEDEDFDSWRRILSIDLDSVFLGCKYALAHMREHAPGSIVNISSIAGLIAGHNMAAYNAAKAGVWLLSKSVALHAAKRRYNIRCNTVHPTFIRTPILERFIQERGEEEVLSKLSRQVPLGHIGEPSDVAYAVLYLASDESKFVTGSELKVDGGISAM